MTNGIQSSKLHCRLHYLGVEVTNGYNIISDSSSCPRTCFSLGPMFFLSISQTKLLRMCLFPCEAYDSRKGGQTHHPKKKWKEKNHEHNPTIPCQTTTCDTMNIRSTPQSEDAQCPYDNVTYCKFTQNSYPNSYPPTSHGTHLNGHAPCHCHRLRRLHDARKLFSHFSGVGGRGGSP